MRQAAILVVFVAAVAVLGAPTAAADVVVRPQWTAEQVGGQTVWFYHWRGQKFHVDDAGRHWAIGPSVCSLVDNAFAPRAGGPLRQMAVNLQGRMANFADRVALR